VALVRTNVSEEHTASIFRVTTLWIFLFAARMCLMIDGEERSVQYHYTKLFSFLHPTSHRQVPLWHSPCPEQLSAQVPFHAIIPNLTSRDNGFCVVSFIILSILITGTSNSALWKKNEHFMLLIK
jgi:hypothetical protein